MRIKNPKEISEDSDNAYEWRIINNKETLNNDLIDKLSDKGIEELELKNKLKIIYKKFNTNKKNENKKLFQENIEDIFKNQSLKYENIKNPLCYDKSNKSIFVTNKESIYLLVSEQIKSIEANITKYLTQDNRQWESVANRTKIKSWLSEVRDIYQFVNILLFFNERIKCPYKTETSGNDQQPTNKKSNKKVLEDDKR